MDETYVRVRGTWKYLYRVVDKAGATVDFLLTAKRDRKAALRFLRKGDQEERNACEDHDQQEWCQHGGADRKPQRRNGGGHRGPSDQIPQQHRRTGSSSHRAAGTADAGVQVLPLRRGDACRHRTHAHDPQRSIADDRRSVPGTAILFVRRISPDEFMDLAYPTGKFATEPPHESRIAVVPFVETERADRQSRVRHVHQSPSWDTANRVMAICLLVSAIRSVQSGSGQRKRAECYFSRWRIAPSQG
jgi:DDE domain